MRLRRNNPDRAVAPADGLAGGPDRESPRVSVFLGSLRSEVDEPPELPAVFAELGLVYDSIIGAYGRGSLTGAQAKHRISLLRITTAAGVEWTIGASSKRWYRRRPGGTWKIAAPPAVADRVAEETGRAALVAVAQIDAPELAAAGMRPATVDTSDLAESAPAEVDETNVPGWDGDRYGEYGQLGGPSEWGDDSAEPPNDPAGGQVVATVKGSPADVPSDRYGEDIAARDEVDRIPDESPAADRGDDELRRMLAALSAAN